MSDLGAATKAFGRNLYLGRRGRFLSRHGAPWRNLQSRFRAGLVQGAGLLRAEWPRHARLQEPHERRLGIGTRNAVGTGTRPQSPRFLRGLRLAQARYRSLLAVPYAGMDQGEDAPPLLGKLGRTGPAPARKFRGFRSLGIRAEMARSARHRTLDPFLHELRRRPAKEVLRSFPQG